MIKLLNTFKKFTNFIFITLFFTPAAYPEVLKSVPSTFTAKTGGEARFLLFLPEGGAILPNNVHVDGLPSDFTPLLTCTGKKGDKCNAQAGTDDLPILTLKVAVPSSAEERKYTATITYEHEGIIYKSTAVIDVREKIKFTHPGIMLNKAMLEQINAHLQSGNPVWSRATQIASESFYGSKSYQPSPHSTVSADGNEATDLRNDAIAAYTQALLWSATHDETYARNAIRIMNAWSEMLSTDFTGSNRFNLAAWMGDVWPRAAEIIRYTYRDKDGNAIWRSDEIARFEDMLNKYYARFILGDFYTSGMYGGNLIASQAAALINIGVFNNDAETFLAGIEKWRRMLPAYIYMKNDGDIPAPPVFWRNNYINRTNLLGRNGYWYDQNLKADEIGEGGISQETCRDLGHVLWGFSALANGSETARIQGIDLHAETTMGTSNTARLSAGLEFNLAFLNANESNKTIAAPAALCGGVINAGQSPGKGEILFNDIVMRRGLSLPETSRYLENQRPTSASYFMIWETMSHYSNP
ncbi:alginate lyase family protein [Pantoea sp.]|uniref:alginate lyase family protein n=1 Tax=Pantoea sp. TaxID=69393 RepID=UPI00289C82BA|nr:alginate lyase family protein [Pantoea sp.]